MVFVERDGSGTIKGVYANPQTFAVEEVLDDAAEVVAFRAALGIGAATRRMVFKSVIIERLHQAGKLAAASAALNADLYTSERWYAPDKPAIYADDAEALALLKAIGADPAVIFAE